jgi:hypothetical protein
MIGKWNALNIYIYIYIKSQKVFFVYVKFPFFFFFLILGAHTCDAKLCTLNCHSTFTSVAILIHILCTFQITQPCTIHLTIYINKVNW